MLLSDRHAWEYAGKSVLDVYVQGEPIPEAVVVQPLRQVDLLAHLAELPGWHARP